LKEHAPYWLVMQEIAGAAENYGIAVYAVPEESTSSYCARYGCEIERQPRGLAKCPYGYVVHADSNAALNVLKKAGGKVPERVKALSFTPVPSGVIERRERGRKRGNREGESDSPASKAGNGVARAIG
jgi:transposase